MVIAATNRLDMLDPALLRPGRFDRRVQVGLPAEAGRLAILGLHSKGMPIADPAALAALARVTAGFAGADLSNMVNEAAIMAARAGRETILAEDLDEGMLRSVAGPQRADRRIADGELEVIAWHEAGHVLAAELCPAHQKAQRVTILARGDAGGLALYGSEDRALTSQQHLHERMVVAMAGRAAEQIRFGMISSGAANDLEQVNGMARAGRRAPGLLAPGRADRRPLEPAAASRSPARSGGRSTRRSAAWSTTPTRTPSPSWPTTATSSTRWARRCSRTSSSTARRSRRSWAGSPEAGAACPPARTRSPRRASPSAPPFRSRPSPLPQPVPVHDDGEAPARAPRRLAPRRRIRTGVEVAAATVYALTLPRLGGRRRSRRKRPGIA